MEYLYEMHSHIKEVSTCSGSSAEDFIRYYSELGYTGLVLTDHMNRSTFNQKKMENAPWSEKAEHFLSGYNALKEAAGDKFIILLGMEISFDNVPNDYLVYGVTEEFIKSNGDLMAMKPRAFSRLANENNMLFLQAHPFRRSMKVEDWDILDGYEVFNGNLRHQSNNSFAELWAKAHQKSIITSGSDFHEEEDAGNGGIYFNTLIKNNDELLSALRSGSYRLRKTDLEEKKKNR